MSSETGQETWGGCMFVLFFIMVLGVAGVLLWQCDVVSETSGRLNRGHERTRESLTE